MYELKCASTRFAPLLVMVNILNVYPRHKYSRKSCCLVLPITHSHLDNETTDKAKELSNCLEAIELANCGQNCSRHAELFALILRAGNSHANFSG